MQDPTATDAALAAAEHPQATATMDAPDDAPRKKRGRRRRRKNGDDSPAAATNAPTTEFSGDHDDEPAGEPEPPPLNGGHPNESPRGDASRSDAPEGERKRRRRRRGGRGRGRRDGEGEGPPRQEPSGHEPPTERFDDAADESDAAPEPAPHAHQHVDRHPPALSEKAIEEIFAKQTFADLGIRNSVLKGVTEMGFVHPTKVQAAIIPVFMSGKDVLGQAKTGSGKTAAFGIPVIHMATRGLPFQTLILCPTRELCIQIAKEVSALAKFTPIRAAAVYGGQAIATQVGALDQGPEIIVATPGRLMDLVQRRNLHLNNVRFVVLDEVDRMLDIGFRDDIRRILSQVKSAHQTLFVSATISDEIEKLARSYMKDPEKLITSAGSLTVSMVEQHYLSVAPWDKRRMLLHLLRHEDPALTLVFCRTKATVDDLARYLCDKGIDAHAIHGDMYQGKRNAVMRRLRDGDLGVLVASDLAARGLDVEGISHVVNYDIPEDPEVYIHRIGRTARAGRTGVAWSLVTPEQGDLLTAIEMLANVEIPLLEYPDFTPGELPERVRAERAAEAQRREVLSKEGRMAAPEAPKPSGDENKDASKFPQGVVPTMLPPKRLRGRVKTSRSR